VVELSLKQTQLLMSNKLFAILLFSVGAFFNAPAFGQKLFTRNATVTFDATAANSPETIKAINKSGTCVLDKSTGAVEMAVLIKGFVFERALMQEHFNENYMESDKFSKANFVGKLDNPVAVDTGKDGTYKTNASGTLTIHGVSKPVSVPVSFAVKSGVVSATLNFSVLSADYGIAIPSMVADKVGKSVNISITAGLEPIKSSK